MTTYVFVGRLRDETEEASLLSPATIIVQAGSPEEAKQRFIDIIDLDILKEFEFKLYVERGI